MNATNIELLSLSRPLVREPDFPKKLFADKNCVSKCVSCNACYRTPAQKSDTVVIAITGIHGNFYSNPFYYNIGDAFGEIETFNANTGAKELIGSWNERFSYTDEDIDAPRHDAR